MELEVVVRKWGNSLGIALPKQAVESEGLKENQKIFIEVHKRKNIKIKDLMGLAEGWKIDAQKVKNNAREEDLERDRKISGFLRNNRNIEK